MNKKRKKEYATDVLKREIEERKMKLKPCPFCNGKAHVSRCADDCRYSAIYCESCGLVAKWYHDYEDEAINHWNKRTKESYNSRIAHCPICHTLCEVKGGYKEGDTNWYEPLDKDEQIEILKKENWDLKMNQQIIEQAIIQMREMFPEQWDKALEEYKRKYGLVK